MRFFKVLMPFLKGEKKQKKERFFQKNILYAQEITALFVTAGTLFLTITLLSYDSMDNSFFQYATNRTFIANKAGYLGAQFAALIFFLWGKASYLLLGFIWSLVGFMWQPHIFFIERMVGLTAFPFIGATLLDAYQNSFMQSVGAHHQGGWIGMILWRLLQHGCGVVGGFVFLYALLWVCLLWIAHYSILSVLLRMVQHVFTGFKLAVFYGYQALIWIVHTKVVQWISSFREISWQVAEVHDQAEESLVFTAAILGTLQDAKMAEKNKVWDELVSLCSNAVAAHKPVMQSVQELSLVETKQSTGDQQLKFFKDVRLQRVERLTSVKKKFFNWDFILLPNSVIALQKKIEQCVALFKPASVTQEMISLAPRPLPVKEEQIGIQEFVEKQLPFKLPSLKILQTKQGVSKDAHFFEKELADRGLSLTEKLKHFGIEGKVTAIRPGPVITCFEYAPQADSKISKITALEDDLAMALCALSIRIVAPIPGRNVIGFEIANEQRSSVYLKEIAHSQVFEKTTARLPLMMGVDTTGNAVVEDLVTMPHLLVAGSTGSGKSVGMHSMLTSLLFCKTPDELKLVLIDPKRLEFVAYADIPHLLFPIITQPNYAAPVLKWIVTEMERRYDTLARTGVRNIFDYQTLQKDSQTMAALPFIVVMIDELADLMMVAGKEVEMNIARIAQMARAAGIYMIVATQRPSVDVVTGLIKANFPSRIAFRVASKIDSRTILDSSGAEKLLGMGDMLFMHSASSNLRRIHGAYVSEKEVLALTDQLKAQRKPNYISLDEVVKKNSGRLSEDEDDALFDEVCEFVQTMEEISISMLQRHYRIGFNRSARLIEQLESRGMIAPAQGSRPRKVIR